MSVIWLVAINEVINVPLLYCNQHVCSEQALPGLISKLIIVSVIYRLKSPGLTKNTRFFCSKINFIHHSHIYQEQRNQVSAGLTLQCHFCRTICLLLPNLKVNICCSNRCYKDQSVSQSIWNKNKNNKKTISRPVSINKITILGGLRWIVG